jgi:hypothetical protein
MSEHATRAVWIVRHMLQQIEKARGLPFSQDVIEGYLAAHIELARERGALDEAMAAEHLLARVRVSSPDAVVWDNGRRS